MAIKMDGKALADDICKHLKYRVNILKSAGFEPTLTIVTSGEDSASQVYVKNKVRRAEEIGIKVDVRHYPKLDKDDVVLLSAAVMNPMIIQEPIAGTAKHEDVANYIHPCLDADCFSYENVGMLATGHKPMYLPCTPRGIMHLLDFYDIPIKGNRVCIIGRSNIVGRPLSWMMEQAGATVTLCHSLTPEKKLYKAIAESRIIVSAVGKPEFISRFRGNIVSSYNIDWGKKTFIDVGINRIDGHLCGDIHHSVYEVSHAYTPVPGGVGPMTVAMLMANVVEYYEGIMHNEGIKREG